MRSISAQVTPELATHIGSQTVAKAPAAPLSTFRQLTEQVARLVPVRKWQFPACDESGARSVHVQSAIEEHTLLGDSSPRDHDCTQFRALGRFSGYAEPCLLLRQALCDRGSGLSPARIYPPSRCRANNRRLADTTELHT